MKRNKPNTKIDSFFALSKPKKTEPIKNIFSNEKKKLVIVKSTSQQKVKRIDLPDISSKEEISKEELDLELKFIMDSIREMFKYDANHINCSKVSQSVELFCRMRNFNDLYLELKNVLKDVECEFLHKMLNSNSLEILIENINNFDIQVKNLWKLLSYFDHNFILLNNKDKEEYNGIIDLIYKDIKAEILKGNYKMNYFISLLTNEIKIFVCDEIASIQKDKAIVLFFKKLDLYDELEDEIIKILDKLFDERVKEYDFENLIMLLYMGIIKIKELETISINNNTIKKILDNLDDNIFYKNYKYIFSDEFYNQLENNQYSNLYKIYSFYNKEKLYSIFICNFCIYFTKNISDLIKGNKIFEIIQKYISMKRFIREIFSNDAKLQVDMSNNFKECIKKDSEKISKLLALYLNNYKNQIEDDIIDFFKLNNSYSIFESSYFILLTKKIFSFSPIDIEREFYVIKIFKDISGSDYTERLEKLINDIKISEKINQQIPFNNIQFKAYSISSTIFPYETDNNTIIYPEFIQTQLDLYANLFFKNEIIKNSFNKEKKKLVWTAKYSRVECLISNTKCILNGEQTLILICIKDKSKTIDEIKEETGIKEESILANINTLSKQNKLIIQTDNNQNLLNPNPLFSQKDNTYFNIDTINAEKDRINDEISTAHIHKNQLSCSIVSKLKFAKILSISELYQRVIHDISFTPEMDEFLDCLSSLSTKHFIEKINQKTYSYVP